ncbi:transposase [Enterobacter kobei]|uniref:RNA-guided endonuclease InsQ/TnpB family protein n=1 Tax=Enterobacter kobei TaxID=208224 RepID=UPI0035134443
MIKKQAFKFRLEPNKNQSSDFLIFAGSCRFVYNKGLALLNDIYHSGKKFMGYNQLASELVGWKSEESLSWLKSSPSQCLQQSLRDLDRAFRNFFSGKAQYPKFKKKGRHDSFRIPCQRVRVDQEKKMVSLPKVGWVKYRKSREIIGELKNVTISMKQDKWYISFNTENTVPDPIHPYDIKTKIVLSDESEFPIRLDRSMESAQRLNVVKKLIRLNRILTRRTKHSNNWLKTKGKIDKIKAKLARCRLDNIHKVTTAICKNHAVVEVLSLMDSVSEKNDIILSLRYEFVRQLIYKQEWLGGKVIRRES